MTERHPGALFSIHDVMPHTLGDVQQLLDGFTDRSMPLPALLVVPGRDWQDHHMARLREWEAAGAELIAHGWRHETRPRGLSHRLHAALFSRNVAEHLALDREGVLALMRDSREWFARQGLGVPTTYVPPAWALGLPRAAFGELPYRCVETLRGVILTGRGGVTLRRLPLVGFEADTRVSIHPRDADLRLGEDLRAEMARGWRCLRYRDLDAESPPVAAAGPETL